MGQNIEPLRLKGSGGGSIKFLREDGTWTTPTQLASEITGGNLQVDKLRVNTLTDGGYTLDITGTSRLNGAVTVGSLQVFDAAGKLSDTSLSSNVPLKNGASTFTGANNFTALTTYIQSTNSYGVAHRISGDTFARFASDMNGKQEWGDGTNTRDTFLYRNAAGILKTDGEMLVHTLRPSFSISNVNGGALGNIRFLSTGIQLSTEQADKIPLVVANTTTTPTANLLELVAGSTTVASVTPSGNIRTSNSIDLLSDNSEIRFVNTGSNGKIRSSGGVLTISNYAGIFGSETINIQTAADRALALQSGTIRFRQATGGKVVMEQYTGTGNMVLQNGGTFADAGYRLDVKGKTRALADVASDVAHTIVNSNTTPTTNLQEFYVGAETFPRLAIDKDGKHTWGTGAAAGDTTLYRTNAGVLKTDAQLYATRFVGILGYGSIANSSVFPSITGTEVKTDISTNVALKVINSDANASTNLLELIKGTTTVARVDNTGKFFGSVDDTALSSNVPKLSSTQTFTGLNTFSSTVYVKDPTSLNYNTLSNYSTGRNVAAVAFSPMGSVWHDVAAFCNIVTPTQEVSSDGVNWTPETLNKRYFSRKQKQTIDTLDPATSRKAIRWIWNGTSAWEFSAINWLVLGHSWTGTASKSIRFESSSDNITWTTRHYSTNSTAGDVVFYKIDDYGVDSYYRLTIEHLSGGNIRLNSIALLTARPGDQGWGYEYQFPYSWDENKKMTFSETDATTIREGGTLLTSKYAQISTTNVFTAYQMVSVGATSSAAYAARIGGDTLSRYVVNGDGKIEWGSGSNNNRDTFLYRAGASLLKTDGEFYATGSIRATNGFANLTTVNNAHLNLKDTGAEISTSVAANIGLKVINSNTTPTGNIQEWIKGTDNLSYLDSSGRQKWNLYSGTKIGSIMVATPTGGVGMMFENASGQIRSDIRLNAAGGFSFVSSAVSGSTSGVVSTDIDGVLDAQGYKMKGVSVFGSDSKVLDAALSSNVVLKNAVNTFTTLQKIVVASESTHAFSTHVSNDAIARYVLAANGKQEWGDGTNARDTNLYRSAANQLKTDHEFVANLGMRGSMKNLATWQNAQVNPTNTGTEVSTAIAANVALKVINTNSTLTANLQEFYVGAEAFPRLSIDKDGKHTWGTGAAAGDVTLYRNSSSELRTGATMRASIFRSDFGLANTGTSNNAQINPTTTGTEISTAISTNVAAKTINTDANATGNLQEWIKGSTVMAKVDAGGLLTATGLTLSSATSQITLNTNGIIKTDATALSISTTSTLPIYILPGSSKRVAVNISSDMGAVFGVQGTGTSNTTKSFKVQNLGGTQYFEIYDDGVVKASAKINSVAGLQENGTDISAKYVGVADARLTDKRTPIDASVSQTQMNDAFMIGIRDIPETEKIKLRDANNWDVNNKYIGAPIVNTFQGQMLGEEGIDDDYEYICRADNTWRRLAI
jgi:hypothetical protein